MSIKICGKDAGVISVPAGDGCSPKKRRGAFSGTPSFALLNPSALFLQNLYSFPNRVFVLLTKGFVGNRGSTLLLPGDIRDFDTPPTLLDRIFARLCRRVLVSGPAVTQVVIGLVHRFMLPELGLLSGSTTPENKCTQKKHNQ
jgi:hypothetical protein